VTDRPRWTRRGALTLIGSGTGLLVWGSGGATNVSVERTAGLGTTTDDAALLSIAGFNSSKTYDSPHAVTVTNQTGTTLSGTNEVTSANDRLEFQTDSRSPSSSLTLDDLNDGESQTFEIITASSEDGDVSDDVTISYNESGGISVDVTRTITVSFRSAGRLVYTVDNDIRVYDAIQDTELDPPQGVDPDVIGANAADFVAGNNADISFIDNNRHIYTTEIGSESDNLVFDRKRPKARKQKTRLALAKWPALSEGSGVSPDEFAIVSATQNSDSIFVVNGDGNCETIIEPENGVDGVSGVADIDDDGEQEMVYIDDSQTLYYLNEDGSTSKIPNGGVGSNNSAGFGPPANFEGFTDIQVPLIDGSQDPALIDSDGDKTKLDSSGPAKKAAVAPVDVDNDEELEFVFLGASNGKIKYIDDVGDSNTIKTLVIGEGADGATDVERTPDEKIGLNSGILSD